MRHSILHAGLVGFLALASTVAAAETLPKLPPLDKTLKPSETALIVVDFQKNFADPKGEHYARYEPAFKATHMIENTVDLVNQARALGIQVVEVTEAYTQDYRELDWGNGGAFHRGQILRQAWKMGTAGVELIDALRPGPNDKDILLPNRITLSGFGSNGLDTILRSRGIRNVAVAGFTTDVCVYATALAAYDLGYRVFALSDLMTGGDETTAKEMLRTNYPMVSRIMDHETFLKMFPSAH